MYILFVTGAAVAFFRAQHSEPPSDGPEAPFVSLVIPVRSPNASLEDLLDTLRASSYPADRYEILVTVPAEGERPSVSRSTTSNGGSDPSLHLIETGSRTPPDARSEHVATQASGDFLIPLPPKAILSPEWLSAVAAHGSPDVDRLTTAVTYEHNERFLPRLQALEQIGHTAASVGAEKGLHSAPPENPSTEEASRTTGPSPDLVSSTAAPEAQVRRPAPAATLGQYVETAAQRLLDAFRQSGATKRFGVALYWLTHSIFLVTGAVAVVAPAWRQPVLLAFLAKMGADLVLAVPAARHFGQRGLLRSIVPTELFLVLAIPAGGLLGGWTYIRDIVRTD